jgi:lipopolysaccharide/colanic/teichoic acid biosynthesis glycosyltransferase
MIKSSEPINVGLPVIALINCDDEITSLLHHCNLGARKLISFKNGIELIDRLEDNDWHLEAIISQSEVMAPSGISLLETLLQKKQLRIPFFIICNNFNEKIAKIALLAGVAEVFKMPFKIENLETRVNFVIDQWEVLQTHKKAKETERMAYKTPLVKRVFDICFAGIVLILLSPIMLLIMILIRLESSGPIFYYALRVGTGYHIFKFYKFRSMYFDADKRLNDLKHLNQYGSDTRKSRKNEKQVVESFLCEECKAKKVKCQYPIYSDTMHMCEKEYAMMKKNSGESTFIKIKNDPRMTRVGKFIRKTSIDENRPLPLYEAEKLTTDKYSLRFMAPAGITGLWQVEKRGNGKMSEEERLVLDNIYAKNHSFSNDIFLILRTIPAIFQKENV